ncbi:MAG TPA: hypothetical protein VJN29_07550 [Intrasporangium sp.]|nr:hypothetical protein [Intrasporangium sp.]
MPLSSLPAHRSVPSSVQLASDRERRGAVAHGIAEGHPWALIATALLLGLVLARRGGTARGVSQYP